MSTISFGQTGSAPWVAFQLAGGALSWQNWLSDPLTITGVREGSSELAVLSLHSGQILLREPATEKQFQLLSQTSGRFLLSADLPEEMRLEHSLWKEEPFDSTGLFFQAIRLQMQGDYLKALDAYDRLLLTNSVFPRVNNLRGLCLRLLQRLEDAEAAYLKEIEVKPHSPDPYANLGIVYLRTGQEQMARTMFERALERDPFYFNALLHLGRLLQKIEAPDSGVLKALHLRILASHGENPATQVALSDAALRLNLGLVEYHARLQSDMDLTILRFLQRLELLRQNGGTLALLRGYAHLLERAGTQKPLLGFLADWIRQRITSAPPLPEPLASGWEKFRQEMLARWPLLAKESGKLSFQPISLEHNSTGPVTAEEFLELLLAEIWRDGQMQPEERLLLSRLGTSLGIEPGQYQRLQARMENRKQISPLIDDGKTFDAWRFFRTLLAAVQRDVRLAPVEKTYLRLAAEAMQLPLSDIEAILSEKSQ
mgnify:CR=1 FL=1